MIKYVCKHKVIGLKRLKKLINPKNLGDRRTYLKAVVEDFEDEAEVRGESGSRRGQREGSGAVWGKRNGAPWAMV